MTGERLTSPAPEPPQRRAPRPVATAPRIAALALLVFATGCSPLYVLRAGLEQARILAARQPMSDVILDPATDPAVRDKLTLVREARAFAADDLRLDVGDSYTSFVDRPSDTLALVLSAAYRDRFEARTWWFPVVGRVPYRGFFDEDEARREQQRLEDEGFDTLLRPTSAFSTLGWFADPLMSTLLRYDHVELVETVIHELSHNHLFVPGQVRFNESWATFVGRVGAIEFFCERPGGGPDSVWCARAQARWRDARRWSQFVDALVADLQQVYSDPDLTQERRLERRVEVYDRHRARFTDEIEPAFESLRFGGFLAQPLNNAVLLGQMRYYHRLDDFERWRGEHGSLTAAVEALVAEIDAGGDPFVALEG